jgi:hypothetical protein
MDECMLASLMLLEVHDANLGPDLYSYSAGRSHQKSALPRIHDSEYSMRVTAGFATAVLQTDTVLDPSLPMCLVAVTSL